eukprot:scaffold176492_cov16-Prasinocladus_malaysianus.AAC.1
MTAGRRGHHDRYYSVQQPCSLVWQPASNWTPCVLAAAINICDGIDSRWLKQNPPLFILPPRI